MGACSAVAACHRAVARAAPGLRKSRHSFHIHAPPIAIDCDLPTSSLILSSVHIAMSRSRSGHGTAKSRRIAPQLHPASDTRQDFEVGLVF